MRLGGGETESRKTGLSPQDKSRVLKRTWVGTEKMKSGGKQELPKETATEEPCPRLGCLIAASVQQRKTVNVHMTKGGKKKNRRWGRIKESKFGKGVVWGLAKGGEPKTRKGEQEDRYHGKDGTAAGGRSEQA